MPKWGGWESTGFGGRLKELREAAGMSQPELAEKAGCNKFTIAKLEQGRQEPAWPLVLALCRALGVACEAFQGAAGAPPTEEPPKMGRPRKAPAEEAAGKKQPKRKGGR